MPRVGRTIRRARGTSRRPGGTILRTGGTSRRASGTIRRAGGATFASLAVPNYRRYVAGQAISLVGTWMQMTAQAWLVLTLTRSSTALGLIVALQTLPVLLLCPYGGVIADRVDKRRVMIALQSAMGVQALILGVLTVTGSETVWEIGLLAALLGLGNAFENPSRQSFMLELVGSEHLRNAVTLNSVLVNLARSIGPAVAGLVIASVGDGVCFLANAASFVAVVASLTTMDTTSLNPTPPAPRGQGQLREGLRHIRSRPATLAVPLLMMAAVGCLTYEFQVSLPEMASRSLHAGATGFGFMTAAMGVGAVASGLVMAARGRTELPMLVAAATGFGISMTFAAAAPTLAAELLALVLVGAAQITFMSTGNATLQLGAAPEMRGRVMSLWFVAFQGSTPVGGPAIGAAMAALGPRAGLGVGAATCLAAALAGVAVLRVTPRRRAGAGGEARSSPASPRSSRRAGSGARATPGTTAAGGGPSAPTASGSGRGERAGRRGPRRPSSAREGCAARR
jgi:MFS family permease